MAGPFKTWTPWLADRMKLAFSRPFSSFPSHVHPKISFYRYNLYACSKEPNNYQMPHYSPISLKDSICLAFASDNRHFFFSTVALHYRYNPFPPRRSREIISPSAFFRKSFFQICSQKANEEITHFISRNTIPAFILFLQTHLAVSFFIKLFLFTKGFHQTFLIKLSVFVRFDERYCEHSTQKDIKARFALRNTNGFCEFSPMRSYRLSWYDEGRRRSDSMRLLLVDLVCRACFIAVAKRHHLSESLSAGRFHCRGLRVQFATDGGEWGGGECHRVGNSPGTREKVRLLK